MTSPPYARNKTQVAIFGGGIAGLTAAHELIERGFDVEVYETDPPSVIEQATHPDMDPHIDCGVGGMARTQWASVHRYLDGETQPNPAPPPGSSTRLPGVARKNDPATRLLLGHVLDFSDNTTATDLSQHHKDEITKIVQLLKDNQIRALQISGFTDEPDLDPLPGDDPYPTDPRRGKDWKRAVNVEKEIKAAMKDLVTGTFGAGYGRRGELTLDPKYRNYVSLEIIDDWLPGEHGFRFFPAFYRHVFDTMRRTPIPDPHSPLYSESARTVLDNVQPTTFFGLSTKNSKLLRFRRRPPTSLQQLFEQLQGELEALGHTIADIARYQHKLFKFMTSCSDRRAAEYEGLSWAEFVESQQFTPNFQFYLDSTAQVLVGLQASRCDARTYGNTSVQMVQDQLSTGGLVDGTLNAPTSEAWFDPWRRYLESQGVRFRRGTLQGFVFFRNAGEVQPWPVVDLPQYVPDPDPTKPPHLMKRRTVLPRDYYVLALPAQELVRIAKDPNWEGDDFDRLRAFPLGDTKQPDPGGALDHMVGIQYYLDSDFTFLHGHIIFPDTPWRLSAVSQSQFWMRKRGWWSGYRGILSVDISNLHSQKDPAWNMTKAGIAAEVWRQITTLVTASLVAEGNRNDAGSARAAAAAIPQAVYYHLDDNIVNRDGQPIDKTEKPYDNKSPYLLCRAGDYPVRPGSPGKYEAHFGRVVLAGTLMQTYTRLTTMEAANESGRHAANTILEVSGFQGERCAVWDPERYELPDLKILVELDQQLFQSGLPHFFDILDMRELAPALLRPGGEAELQSIVVRALESTGVGAHLKAPSGSGETNGA